jgi:hypothetical protein
LPHSNGHVNVATTNLRCDIDGQSRNVVVVVEVLVVGFCFGCDFLFLLLFSTQSVYSFCSCCLECCSIYVFIIRRGGKIKEEFEEEVEEDAYDDDILSFFSVSKK